MTTNRKTILLAATSLVVAAQFAHAAPFVWDGGGADNNWSTGLNWDVDAAPAATADTMTFDNAGVGKLANTVDAGLAGTAFSRLLYRQDSAANVYTTSIDRSVNLTLNFGPASNTATAANATMVVMPFTDTAAFGGSTLSHVVFNNTGTGTAGALNITAGNFLVSGRPGTSNAFHSGAILDLSGLSSFTYSQALPQIAGNNAVFGVGTGQGAGSGDNGAVYGKLILAPVSTITSNRVSIGGQNSGGTSSTNPNLHGIQPMSHLMLGQSTTVNPNLSGNVYAGGDPGGSPTRTASGAWIFQTGLTNPTVTIGAAGAFVNGLEVGRHRGSTGHSVFGVMDYTSASGTSDGILNGEFAGWSIGFSSTGTAESGGGYGMLNMNDGTANLTGSITMASVNGASSRGSAIAGTLNVGVRGAPNDTGAGTINAAANLVVGQRTVASSGSISRATVTVDNNGSLTANRVFIGNNTIATGTGTDMPIGSVIGIVNLNGGTLTTGQVQKGADPVTQLGTNTTRLINFDGGTLKVKTGTTFGATYMEGLNGAYVYAGGGTIDTNGQNVTINQPLSAPTGDGIDGITVNTAGSNYKVAPIVMISGGGGVGATAVARIDGTTGAVLGVDVTNRGTGYTSAPLIELVANGGTNLPFGVTAGTAPAFGNIQNHLYPYAGTKATTTANLLPNVGGTITKTGAGTLTVPNVRLPGVAANGGTLKAAEQANPYVVASEAGTSKVTTLSASSGLIDLTNTKIITQDASFTTPTYDGINDIYVYDGVHGLVQRGRGDGSWNGTSGVTTSQTDATTGTLTSLAVGTGAELRGLGPTDTELFAGQTINGDSTVVMYTYGGDADMDGDLDGDDYFYLDSNVLQSETVFGWHQGDFNYDGRLNGDDYFILDSNILQAQASGNVFWVRPPEFASGSSGLAAVPEPASIGLIGVAATGLLGRRRRAK